MYIMEDIWVHIMNNLTPYYWFVVKHVNRSLYQRCSAATRGYTNIGLLTWCARHGYSELFMWLISYAHCRVVNREYIVYEAILHMRKPFIDTLINLGTIDFLDVQLVGKAIVANGVSLTDKLVEYMWSLRLVQVLPLYKHPIDKQESLFEFVCNESFEAVLDLMEYTHAKLTDSLVMRLTRMSTSYTRASRNLYRLLARKNPKSSYRAYKLSGDYVEVLYTGSEIIGRLDSIILKLLGVGLRLACPNCNRTFQIRRYYCEHMLNKHKRHVQFLEDNM